MNDPELRLLEAVRRLELDGRPGTAADLARALGHDDRATVSSTLEALEATRQVEREQSDELCVDCDWPAAPFGSYRLTSWGRVTLAGGGLERQPGLEAGMLPFGGRAVERAVELGIQAFEKTGDLREALIEATGQAWQAGHTEGEAMPASMRSA
jgi:hypothetical protein